MLVGVLFIGGRCGCCAACGAAVGAFCWLCCVSPPSSVMSAFMMARSRDAVPSCLVHIPAVRSPLAITCFFVVLNRARHAWLEMDELLFVFLAFVNVAVMAIPNGYAPRPVLFSVLLLIIAGARAAVRYATTSLACRQARPQLRKALWAVIFFLTLYALLQIFTGVQMHYRQGTTFERETLYFLVDYDIFH